MEFFVPSPLKNMLGGCICTVFVRNTSIVLTQKSTHQAYKDDDSRKCGRKITGRCQKILQTFSLHHAGSLLFHFDNTVPQLFLSFGIIVYFIISQLTIRYLHHQLWTKFYPHNFLCYVLFVHKLGFPTSLHHKEMTLWGEIWGGGGSLAIFHLWLI
jgi:hypothetical protein